MNWNEFGKIVTFLSEKIAQNYKPDTIIGVGKSGVIPASIVTKLLNVNEFHLVTVRFYNEGKPPKPVSDKPKIIHHTIKTLKGKNVLVVDDFARSGNTLRLVTDFAEKMGAKKVESAVLALREDAEIQPDYYGIRFEGCVIFPWDA